MRTFPEIRDTIDSIDRHVDAVAKRSESGSEIETLAYAIGNVCRVLRALAEHLEAQGER